MLMNLGKICIAGKMKDWGMLNRALYTQTARSLGGTWAPFTFPEPALQE